MGTDGSATGDSGPLLLGPGLLPARGRTVRFCNQRLDSIVGHEHRRSTRSYLALTDGRRNLLREQIVFSAAWHLDEVLPNIPNPPSPFLETLSDRIVLDIWGGQYTDIARNLEILSSYGISRCVALIHDWQRSGYDNALPAHLPAASDKGGDEGMKTLVETGARLGYLVALHENYVDYYPNYDHFSEADIALRPGRSPPERVV